MTELEFRYQYMITNQKINNGKFFDGWNENVISDELTLFSHSELNFKTINLPDISIFVLGYYFNTDLNLSSKSSDDMSFFKCKTIEDVQRYSKPLCGRYVILVKDANNKVTVFSDALSLRNVYYYFDKVKDIKVITSDVNLFVKYIPEKLLVINNESHSFYKNDLPKVGAGNCWVGSETIYSNLYKLMPNMEINCNDFIPIRYWPINKMEKNDTSVVVKLLAVELMKVIEIAASENSLSLAITAGYDSRVIAAASYKVKDNIHYFIDRHEYMNKEHPDLLISAKVAKLMGVPFQINQQNMKLESIPQYFRNTYKNNSFLSSDIRLPTIYFYYNNYKKYLNVCGVGEIGRNRFGRNIFKITPKRLAYKYGYVNCDYANAQCKTWLDEAINVTNKFKINPFTLFYWEMDLGNWGSVGNVESDISFEEFNPFNSHKILELMLSIDYSDSKRYNNTLFHGLINELMPELNSLPINPASNLKDRIKQWLKTEPQFTYLDYARYKMSTFKSS